MLNDLYCFNSTTSSWEVYDFVGAPTPRISFGFISLKGMLYVFGGQTVTQTITSEGNLCFLERMNTNMTTSIKFCLESCNSMKCHLPIGFWPEYNMAICAAICAIPSTFITSYNGELHQFDPLQQKWTDLSQDIAAPAPAGRCGMGFAADEDRLLVFGGCTTTRKIRKGFSTLQIIF